MNRSGLRLKLKIKPLELAMEVVRGSVGTVRNIAALFFALLFVSEQLPAATIGEEVEINSGAITALPCGLAAKATGRLTELSSCAMSDTVAGYAVFDVTAKEVYRISPKKVYLYELERAFGGGSIDLSGVVIEQSDGLAVIEVKDYSINARPKPGAFKGCL